MLLLVCTVVQAKHVECATPWDGVKSIHFRESAMFRMDMPVARQSAQGWPYVRGIGPTRVHPACSFKRSSEAPGQRDKLQKPACSFKRSLAPGLGFWLNTSPTRCQSLHNESIRVRVPGGLLLNRALPSIKLLRWALSGTDGSIRHLSIPTIQRTHTVQELQILCSQLTASSPP